MHLEANPERHSRGVNGGYIMKGNSGFNSCLVSVHVYV